MHYIAASFVILIFSVAGIFVVCMKMIVLLLEESKFWGVGRLIQLVPTFILTLSSVPQIFEMIIYATEVVPSILMGRPPYGATVHIVFGFLSSITFYGTVLQLLVLSVFKSNHITKRNLRFQDNTVRFAIVTCWILSAGMAFIVRSRICHYEMPVADYFAYECNKSDQNRNLATITGILCGASMLLTAVLVVRNYFINKGVVQPQMQANFTVASGTVQFNLPDDYIIFELGIVVHHWNRCLGFQLGLCFCKTVSAILVWTLKKSVWFSLFHTVVQIIYCALSNCLYMNEIKRILNYMYNVELKNAVRTSLLEFRKWSSQRSLRSSFRASCQLFRQSQIKKKNVVRRCSVASIVSDSTSHVKIPLPDEYILATVPASEPAEVWQSNRLSNPVIEVEVYKSKDDNRSFSTDEPGDSKTSLTEDHAKLLSTDSGPPSLCGTSYSSADNVEFLVAPEIVFH